MAKQETSFKIKIDVENVKNAISSFENLAKEGGEVGAAAQKGLTVLQKLLRSIEQGTSISQSTLQEYAKTIGNVNKDLFDYSKNLVSETEKVKSNLEEATKSLKKFEKEKIAAEKKKSDFGKKRKEDFIMDTFRKKGFSLLPDELKNEFKDKDGKYHEDFFNDFMSRMYDKDTLDKKSKLSLNTNITDAEKLEIRLAKALMQSYKSVGEEWRKQSDKIKDDTDLAIKNFDDAKKVVDNYKKQILNLPDETLFKGIKTSMAQCTMISQELTKSYQEMGRVGVSTAKIEDKTVQKTNTLTKSFFKYGIVMRVLKRTLQESVKAVREIDDAITNMTVVTGESRKETNAYIADFSRLAQATSSTISEIADLTTEFVRQGRSVKDAMIMAEETAKAAKIAGISVRDSLTYMTSAINGFNLSAKDAAHVSDVFAKIAAVSATDYNQLAVALSKVSAQANQAGMSIEYTTALLAKGIETTQEAPESIGTALKTVIARFRELSDFGSTLEDGATVNGVEDALAAVGIALRDETGEFRSLQDVLNELGPIWNDLTGMQRQAIAQAAAGTRQQSRFLAIMQDWERTMTLVNTGQEAIGASAAQYAKYSEGMTAAITRLDNAWQSLVLSLTNNDVIISLVDTGTSFLNILTSIFDATKNFTSYIPITIAAITAIKMVGNKLQQKEMASIENEINKRKVLGKEEEKQAETNNNLAKQKIQLEIDKLKVEKQAAKESEKAAATELKRNRETLESNLSILKTKRDLMKKDLEIQKNSEKSATKKAALQSKIDELDAEDYSEYENMITNIKKEEEDLKLKLESGEKTDSDIYYDERIESLESLKNSMDRFGSTATIFQSKLKSTFTRISRTAKQAWKDLNTLGHGFNKTATGVKVSGAALVGGIALSLKFLDDTINYEKKALENLAKLSTDSYDKQNSINSLRQIKDEYEKLNSTLYRTAEEENRLQELKETLINEYHLDGEFDSIQNHINSLNVQIAQNTQESIEQAFEVAITKGKKAFEDAKFKTTIETRMKLLNDGNDKTPEGKYHKEEYNKLVNNFDLENFSKNSTPDSKYGNQTKASIGAGLLGVGTGVALGVLAGTPVGWAALLGAGVAHGTKELWEYLTGNEAKAAAKEIAKQTSLIATEFNQFSEAMSESMNKRLSEQVETYKTAIGEVSDISKEAIKKSHAGFEAILDLKLTSEQLDRMQMKDENGQLGFSNKQVLTLITQAGEMGEESAKEFFDSWEKISSKKINTHEVSAILATYLNGGDSKDIKLLLSSMGISNEDKNDIINATDGNIAKTITMDMERKKGEAEKKKKIASDQYEDFKVMDYKDFKNKYSNLNLSGYTKAEAEQILRNNIQETSEAYNHAKESAENLTSSLLDMISPFQDLLSLSQGLKSIDTSVKNTQEFAQKLKEGTATVEDWTKAAVENQDVLTSDAWKNAKTNEEKALLISGSNSVFNLMERRANEINDFILRTQTDAIISKQKIEESDSSEEEKQEKIEALEKSTEATIVAAEEVKKLGNTLRKIDLEKIEEERKNKEFDKRIKNGDISAYNDKKTFYESKSQDATSDIDSLWSTQMINAAENNMDISQWKNVMDEMWKGNITPYEEMMEKIPEQEQAAYGTAFKAIWEMYSKILADKERIDEEVEKTEESYLNTKIEKQEEAIEKYKKMMNDELEETKKSLDSRKKLYEKYFDMIDDREDENDYEEKRQVLLNSISALATSSDDVSLSMLKDAEKELKNLESQQRKKESENRKKSTLETLDEEKKIIEDNYKKAVENNQNIWNLFGIMGIETIKNIYKVADGYENMSDDKKKKWDQEWSTKTQFLQDQSFVPTISVDPVASIASYGNQAQQNQLGKTAYDQILRNSNQAINNNSSSVSFGDLNLNLNELGVQDTHNATEVAKAIYEIFRKEMQKRGIAFNYNP